MPGVCWICNPDSILIRERGIMKNLLAYILVVACASASASASYKVTIQSTSPVENSNGDGAFLVQSIGTNVLPDPNAITGFQSFCLETSLPVTPGSYFVNLSTSSAVGHTSNGSASEPLDIRTAYLYHAFRTNPESLNASLIDGASFTAPEGSIAQTMAAAQLQQAIYYLQDQTMRPVDGSPTGLDNALVDFANGASQAGWTDIGNVRVMQLWAKSADGSFIGNRGSQLTLVIPAPGALLLGFLGIGAIIVVCRFRAH